MTYWFVRMRQGSGGPDFASDLWRKQRVGILYGRWRLRDLVDRDGKIDAKKLTLRYIKSVCPDPHPKFSEKWVKQIKNFIVKVHRDDKVVAVFDGAIHIGTVCGKLLDDNTPRLNGEFFKCQKIKEQRSYPLAELPSVYRLIGNMP